MIVEIRKVISKPLVKKTIEQICKQQGISPTQYAYNLILEDVDKRTCNDRLCSELANEKFSPNTFLAEVMRIVEKYEKSLIDK